MKENENRGFCQSAYTTPASVFNTVAVDFEKKDEDLPEPILKTCPMPVQSLQKLDPEVSETQMKQKMGTLERTPSRTSSDSATPKMGSLERNLPKTENNSPKMNSLERNTHITNSSHNSLDKVGMFSPKLGSLERKSKTSSPKMGSLERNAHIANQGGTFSPKMSSLERNSHIIYPAIPSKIYDIDQIPNYHPDPTIYQFASNKSTEAFEENIYDFGGADVKSCAHKQPHLMQKYGPSVVDNKVLEHKVRIQA